MIMNYMLFAYFQITGHIENRLVTTTAIEAFILTWIWAGILYGGDIIL